MKKWSLIMLLAFAFCLVCGCSKEKDKNPDTPVDGQATATPSIGKDDELPPEKKVEAFVYGTGDVGAFCLDKDGNLYTYEAASGIVVYDKTGTKTNTIAVESGNYCSMCVSEDALYAVVLKSGVPAMSVVEITLADGSARVIYEEQYGWDAGTMEYLNGKVYFLVKSAVYDMTKSMEDVDANYFYGGEKMMCYTPATKKVEELSLDYVKLFCKKDDSHLYLYAYDPEIGELYFVLWDATTEQASDRYYVGRTLDGFLSAVTYEDQIGQLVYLDAFRQALVAANPQNVEEQNSFFSTEGQLYHGYQLKSQAGSTYFLSGNRVSRVTPKECIKSQVSLKILSETTQYGLPEGSGFTFDMETVDQEAMATALLAGDSDYDMLLLSTDSPLAEQIRRTGAYAPLTEVSGVNGYLNESFDYLRAAATAENGAIWMLPYEVDCDLLAYNPELLINYGIDLEQNITEQYLLDVKRTLRFSVDSAPAYFQLSLYREMERCMELYLADYAVKDGNANFDTELFRMYAELMKNMMEEEKMVGDDATYSVVSPGNAVRLTPDASKELIAGLYRMYYKQVAFAAVDTSRFLQKYGGLMTEGKEYHGPEHGLSTFEFMKVKQLPSLEPSTPQKNVAKACFLIVNPKSKKLSAAKEYVTYFANRMRREESVTRTKDLKGTYTEAEQMAHEVYRNSRIVFALPQDVFFEEFTKYLNGEKTLDAVIPELNRRLDAYRKE